MGPEALADDAWEHLPPAAAALFIVLVIVLGGGIWLARAWIQVAAARVDDEPSATSTGPGARTLLKLTRAQVDRERARSEATQDERIGRCEARIDEIFRVEGRHQAELKFEIAKLDTRLGKLETRDD